MGEKPQVNGDRGILTEKDRKYLVGDVDLSQYKNPQKQDNLFRHRIRERVERGIKDFIFIDKYLSKEDWDKILEDWKEFESEIETEASETGEVPSPQNHEYPDVLQGLHSGIAIILNVMAEIQGRDYALSFLEENLKEVIQTQTALENDEFYYGEITFQLEKLENNTVDLDDAFELLVDAVEAREYDEEQDDLVEEISELLDDFVDQLPDMPNSDYVALIDMLHLSGRLSSEEEYQLLRKVMWAKVWEVQEQAMRQAIQDWHLDPEKVL
ncbi:hypothetical protein [Halorhabdus amylolytica]|uniref:hypothetical protein n=1 Tax=Halorhabdus amylolytica TaxID=2559573 RepID=UPI0010AAAAC6|nr:hypothetical protein [Halorhabdus amylolytica]